MKRSPLKRKSWMKRGGKLDHFSKSPHKVARRVKRNQAMAEYKRDHPICEFNGCAEPTCDVHHRASSVGVLIHEKRFFMSLCRHHHDWIHFDAEGKRYAWDNGLLICPDVALKELSENSSCQS